MIPIEDFVWFDKPRHLYNLKSNKAGEDNQYADSVISVLSGHMLRDFITPLSNSTWDNLKRND